MDVVAEQHVKNNQINQKKNIKIINQLTDKQKDGDMLEIESDPYDNSVGEKTFHEGYGDWKHIKTNNERTILKDLNKYNFSDEIKNQADVIYNKMVHRVRRGKIRTQLLFFCVYYAHIELNILINPTLLGEQFKLKQGDVQKCNSLFAPLQTGYNPPYVNTSPIKYLPDYCAGMDLSQHATEQVIQLAQSILKKDPSLLQYNPQTVSAGILRYYIITNGIMSDDTQKITKVTNRSIVTIESMCRHVTIIDNK